MELMVVVTILMGILALVPMNLYRFGARSRLENAANTLVAAVSASRSQAILDAYPVSLEFGPLARRRKTHNSRRSSTERSSFWRSSGPTVTSWPDGRVW